MMSSLIQARLSYHNYMALLKLVFLEQPRGQFLFSRQIRLGMRYEAGICTIVISMNGAFQSFPFCCKLNFDPKKQHLGSSAIFGKKCDWQ